MASNAGTRIHRKGAVAGLLTLTPLIALGAADEANAETLKVTNFTRNDPGSFEWAVHRANRDRDRDKIVFSASLSGDLRTGNRHFTSAVALKNRSDDLALRGRKGDTRFRFGARNTSEHPDQVSTVRGLDLEGIQLMGTSSVDFTVTDTTTKGRDVPESTGIYGYEGELEVKRTIVSNFGTGISQGQASMKIEDSLIAGNTVGTVNYKGSTKILRSTITGSDDTGVYAGYYGFARLINSTVSGNEGWGLNGDVALENSTLTDNDGAVNGYEFTEFENSIIAGNERSGGGDECYYEAPESRGGNVFSAGSDCAVAAGPDDRVVADVELGPLADNGGPTPTRALLPGSAAIGLAGKDATPQDQRGMPRGKHPDSGAFELAYCGTQPVNVVGTDGRDRLRGTLGDDGIFAGKGNDRVNGRGGNDSICGGAGKDRLKGSRGNDRLDGGRGKDRCSGGAGNDRAKRCESERGTEG